VEIGFLFAPFMNRLWSVSFSFTLVLASLLLLAVSCKSTVKKDDVTNTDTPKTPPDFDKIIPGVWIGSWLHVEVTGAGGTPLDRVIDVREENWKETFKRTPLRTEYFPNHTFKWTYYDRDTLKESPVISWEMRGDSMIQTDTSFANNNFHYKVIYQNDSLLEFRTKVDWDFDGSNDDLYYGHIRRARKGE
jgi:hypothetical protein